MMNVSNTDLLLFFLFVIVLSIISAIIKSKERQFLRTKVGTIFGAIVVAIYFLFGEGNTSKEYIVLGILVLSGAGFSVYKKYKDSGDYLDKIENNNTEDYISDIDDKSEPIEKKESDTCPNCGGRLSIKSGPNGLVAKCENCDYSKNV